MPRPTSPRSDSSSVTFGTMNGPFLKTTFGVAGESVPLPTGVPYGGDCASASAKQRGEAWVAPERVVHGVDADLEEVAVVIVAGGLEARESELRLAETDVEARDVAPRHPALAPQPLELGDEGDRVLAAASPRED